jgi:hypothetical protein
LTGVGARLRVAHTLAHHARRAGAVVDAR